MVLKIKNINGETLYEKECVQIVLDTKIVHAYIADKVYMQMNLTQGNLYKITAEGLFDEDVIAEFLARQVNLNTWTDSEGVTRTGITNNTCQFKIY